MTDTDTEQKKAICPYCEGTDFWVTESITYKAHQDEDQPDTVNCRHKTCEIESVICADCKEDITEDLTGDGIFFNFD